MTWLKGFLVFAAVPARAATLRGSHEDLAAAGLWVPVELSPGGAVRYVDAKNGAVVSKLPPRAVLATTQVGETVHLGQKPFVENCAPKCEWQCTKSECERECRPKCDVPKCKTMCEEPKFGVCRVECSDKPHCAIICKHQNCTSGCQEPKCETKCTEPLCGLRCHNEKPVNCTNVCEKPHCTWACKDPIACPPPSCHIKCNDPSNCSKAWSDYSINKDALAAQGFTEDARTFHANASEYFVGAWSACNCVTKRQVREVMCSGGQGLCDHLEKPPTIKACDATCEVDFDVGPWGDCHGECFSRGYQTRQVICKGNNETDNACHSPNRPQSLKTCVFEGERCHKCQATLYGGPRFDGNWKETFDIGTYTSMDLDDRNVKCQDMSSLKVSGFCCRATVYQYGDLHDSDRTKHGWRVTFPEGNYDRYMLKGRGAQDNDTSSLRVWVDERCVEMHRKGSAAGVSLLAVFAIMVAGLF